MNRWVIGGLCCLAGAAGYLLWQKRELTKFDTTYYQIHTDKVQKEHRLAVLADLHGFSYGESNWRLLAKLRRLRPELILIAGDMIVSRDMDTWDSALDTLKSLCAIAPVYYGMGNHESRAASRPALAEAFGQYRQAAEALGVTFLDNRSCRLLINGDPIVLWGLELELDYYEKGKGKAMEKGHITELLGQPQPGELQLLLAHNPAYGADYAAWGADVAFCGHNHGGLVRIPGLGGIVSPQLTPFPKYGEGLHKLRDRYVITSRGLGTHTFHVRVCNRAELLAVTIGPQK